MYPPGGTGGAKPGGGGGKPGGAGPGKPGGRGGDGLGNPGRGGGKGMLGNPGGGGGMLAMLGGKPGGGGGIGGCHDMDAIDTTSVNGKLVNGRATCMRYLEGDTLASGYHRRYPLLPLPSTYLGEGPLA